MPSNVNLIFKSIQLKPFPFKDNDFIQCSIQVKLVADMK